MQADDLYQTRVSKLSEKLTEANCDALLVDDPINLYYLTGMQLSAGTLLVHTRGATLLVDNRYYEMCKKRVSFPVILHSHPDTLKETLQQPEYTSIHTLAFCQDTTIYGKFQKLEHMTNEISDSQRKLQLLPLDNIVAKQRSIKDRDEIEALLAAATLGSEGYDFVCTRLKEGVSENEIAIELEIFWKRKGSKALAFDPIIAFGANSSMPHYRVGRKKLKQGQNILIDIGVNYQHYHSDMTRVLFFGNPDPQLLNIYQIVQEAQERALKVCHPGTTLGELDAAAREYISEKGYGDNFTHSLGHGIGLEIHEHPIIRNKPPFRDLRLEPGMAITVEPGIYLPGIGGIRIEDTVVITTTGHENLTNRSKEPRIL